MLQQCKLTTLSLALQLGIDLALLDPMMKKQKFGNLFKSRYFYVITLLSVWLLVLIFHFNSDKVTGNSLQLSSSATTGAMSASITPITQAAAVEATPLEKYYDVQLKILRDQSASVVSADPEDESLTSIVLKKNSVISVSVPASAFSGSKDPTKERRKNVFISGIMKNLEPVNEGLFNGRTEVTIIGADRANKQYINENARMSLKTAFDRGEVNIVGIEEVEEVDDGVVESDDEIDAAGEDVKVQSSCIGGICFTPSAPTVSKPAFDLLEWAAKILPQSKSIDQTVADYERSNDVKELMATLHKGYPAVLKRNKKIVRRAFPRAPIVSRSIGACYNGVKTALARGGMIGATTDLHGVSAKTAGPELIKQGFINLMDDPTYKNKITSPNVAPLGSVLVYEGHGPKRKKDSGYKHGHIEIKTENGFISDYYSTNSRTGDAIVGGSRKLIGVYIKSKTQAPTSLASADVKAQGSL